MFPGLSMDLSTSLFGEGGAVLGTSIKIPYTKYYKEILDNSFKRMLAVYALYTVVVLQY